MKTGLYDNQHSRAFKANVVARLEKTLLCPVLSTFWVTLKIVNYVQRTIEIAQSIVMYRQKCLRIYFHIIHYVVYLPIEIFMAKRKIFTFGKT